MGGGTNDEGPLFLRNPRDPTGVCWTMTVFATLALFFLLVVPGALLGGRDETSDKVSTANDGSVSLGGSLPNGCPEGWTCCGPPPIDVWLSHSSIVISEDAWQPRRFEQKGCESAHEFVGRVVGMLKEERPERIEVRLFVDDDVPSEVLWQVFSAITPCGRDKQDRQRAACLHPTLWAPDQVEHLRFPQGRLPLGPRLRWALAEKDHPDFSQGSYWSALEALRKLGLR